LEKILQDAGVKLSSVATDILGVSGRAMLAALVEGTRDPEVLSELGRLTPEELLDMASMGKALDLTGDPEALDVVVVPRGHRLLAQVPQLPPSVVERVVERFGSLRVILAVGVEDLEEAEGVGPDRARQLREGLKRLAEGTRPDGHG